MEKIIELKGKSPSKPKPKPRSKSKAESGVLTMSVEPIKKEVIKPKVSKP